MMNRMHLSGAKRLKRNKWLTKYLTKYFGQGQRRLCYLVSLLSEFCTDKPDMGFVYEAMDEAKEQIKAKYGDKRQNYCSLWIIIDERWNKQVRRPLHATDYYLNPRYVILDFNSHCL